ncbi:MAG: aspartate-semialdehyde dehydrogenase [Saprospiraceae bacterium]|jgi:aspartate-semialdehyde dehydrogenase|nr:aspartate-semialdehyde dehydrogenase [Saprospiraceae bacterium]
MKVALVGATGLVGRVMNKVLEEFDFPVTEYIPVASHRSVGTKVSFKDKAYPIVSMEDAISKKADIAIFSAGGNTSLEWAPRFAEAGTTVIDNSSAWRMDPSKKLIVPEINAHTLTSDDKIIANPNCSTIQMVMALAPLHKKYGIKRLVVSTYQSFTGTGAKAVAQYEAERDGKHISKEEMAYHYKIYENCIPQCDVFLDNHYTKEEMKLVHETRKILGDNKIAITATAVRVPVHGGHSESVNVELENPYELDDIFNILSNTSGIIVEDDIATFRYPMPLYAKDRNEVFVGRIRRDESIANGLNLWIVADNLRKGAATNAVQIAQYLHKNRLV